MAGMAGGGLVVPVYLLLLIVALQVHAVQSTLHAWVCYILVLGHHLSALPDWAAAGHFEQEFFTCAQHRRSVPGSQTAGVWTLKHSCCPLMSSYLFAMHYKPEGGFAVVHSCWSGMPSRAGHFEQG